MDRAFRLGQSTEIVKSGRVYDLHNDYLPTAIVVDTQSKMLRLVFRKIATDNDGENVVLQFRDLEVLEFSGNFGESSALGLDEMGYKDADDYDYDWLSTERQSKVSDHMIIRFDGGGTIRIHSARADLIEDSVLTAMEVKGN